MTILSYLPHNGDQQVKHENIPHYQIGGQKYGHQPMGLGAMQIHDCDILAILVAN